MKCKCGKTAVIFKRYDGQALCKDHFCRSVEKRIRRTIRQEKLISRGDHVAVGVSGGKDSTLTLYMLSKIAKRDKRFKVSAIIVDEGIKGYRRVAPVRKICKSFDIPLHVATFKDSVGTTMDAIIKKRDILKKRRKAKTHEIDDDVGDVKACTYCGVFRRKVLNEKAIEIGATKLAIGHNLDDEVQSIMANYIRGDLLRAARIGARAFVVKDKRFVPRIKPLRSVMEKETALYAMIKGFDVDFSECPHGEGSFRWEIRDMLNDFEVRHAGTKHSILATFDRLLPFLQKEYAGQKITSCKRCKEPASGEVCKACQLIEKLDV